jgi:hypothetical protein
MTLARLIQEVRSGLCCRFRRGSSTSFTGQRSTGRGRGSVVGPGCAKTRAFNLRVESFSQFGQSENQKCWRRLSEEGTRENGSTLSRFAHVFTRPRSRGVLAIGYQTYGFSPLAQYVLPLPVDHFGLASGIKDLANMQREPILPGNFGEPVCCSDGCDRPQRPVTRPATSAPTG